MIAKAGELLVCPTRVCCFLEDNKSLADEVAVLTGDIELIFYDGCRKLPYIKYKYCTTHESSVEFCPLRCTHRCITSPQLDPARE